MHGTQGAHEAHGTHGLHGGNRPFLERRMDNKWVFGVCSGIADRLGVEPRWVRLAFVVIPALPGGLAIPPVIVAYLIAGLLLPKNRRFA